MTLYDVYSKLYLVPISVDFIVTDMLLIMMSLIMVVYTAYFCLSNRNGNVYYDRASLSGSM